AYPTERAYVERGSAPSEHALDIRHMRVELSFEPAQKLVRGTVTHLFVPLRPRVDSVFFDGPGITIRRALLHGRDVRHRVSAEGVTVYPDPPLAWDVPDSITFVYEAHPEKGLYFVGWDDPRGMSRKQIWSQGQGIDNRHWIPSYDRPNDKMTTETIVTFDSAYGVLSNGTLVEVREHPGGTRTWHYRMTHPHSTYLVMLAIGKYGVKTVRTRAGVPVNLWYYPDQPERIEPTYRYAAAMVDFLAEATGVPYPWESYSQVPVQDFLYGGMENTTATVYGDFLYVDPRGFLDRNYIGVGAHELAHQWFGDCVTARSGAGTWLQESFATFYAKLFQESVFGEDWYEWARREEQNAALEASKVNRVPITHSAAGSARVYQKGSAVLDMMMSTFGADELRRVIGAYVRAHAYANVETNDLYQSFQDVLGLSPDWFFNQWIYRGGEPRYAVRLDEDVRTGGSRAAVFTVTQEQKRDGLVGLFTMPITFQVHYTDGSSSDVRTTISEENSVVTVPTPGGKTVAFALFDPGGLILKSVDFPKSAQMLRAQLAGAPLMIDRYDALAAMRSWPVSAKREILARTFGRETFHAMREEVLAQIAGDTTSEGITIIRKGLHDPEASVREAALLSASAVLPAVRNDAETMLRDSSYAAEAQALKTLCARFPGETPRYLAETNDDTGTGHVVSVLWHEISAGRGETSSLERLVDYAGVSYEFMTRVNALEALKRLGYSETPLMEPLFSAMASPNPRLRGPAAAVAGYFMEQTRYRSALIAYYRSHHWTAAEERLLAPVFK
ncbi:MAG TPA: M1 family metallopeptidase, partial [Bacteroidota bacterium]|nr:M1 family metallopeptidase [Bacteroidota bacterium]